MKEFRIRFNKTAGQEGRGTVDHVWRVFEESGHEYLCKKVFIMVSSETKKDPNGHDWNIVCNGYLIKDKLTSTITIVNEIPVYI